MRRELDQAIQSSISDIFETAERLDDKSGAARFRCNTRVAGVEVCVRVEVNAHFPLVLPAFYLEPWDSLGYIPHVAPNGFICYLSPEGMVLDESRPGNIIREAFSRVSQLLLDGVSGANLEDFVDEFEACWSYLDPPDQFILVSNPDSAVRTLGVDITSIGGVVGQNRNSIARLFPNNETLQRYASDAVLFLPLKPDSFVLPPKPDGPFWTAADIRELIVGNLSPENQRSLDLLLQLKRAPKEYVIASLPRTKGGESLFGMTIERVGKVHPLLPGGEARAIVPARVFRWDRDFLLGRGGARAELLEKSVLIVGCGSLGGRIATELSRTGISSLTLVDEDNLAAENTYRHVLGRSYWLENKATALKSSLEKEIPYLRVKAIDKTIEDAIFQRKVRFDQYDLVIFATGNSTVELRMNNLIAELADPPAVLFTWLEPLGIGGHALLVQPTLPGCLKCLFEESYDLDLGLYNKSAFAGAGQSFGRAVSGCGSLFTPFSSLDAASTAILASRLAVSALSGTEVGNPVLSWKGDPAAFLDAGFELSPRFDRSDKQLYDGRYSYQALNCPICSSRREGSAPSE